MSITIADRFIMNQEIGLLTFNRSVEVSCAHATEFCTRTCYTLKERRIYANTVGPADLKNEVAWHNLTPEALRELRRTFDNPAHLVRRVRMFSRGEGFSSLADIARAEAILAAVPATLFMWPTRAWRDAELRPRVRELQDKYPNLRLLASTDPTTTRQEFDRLHQDGWSTMHFGDEGHAEKWFRCPKTYAKLKQHCATCKAGCFKAGQVHVHLKQH